jgi:peptidoglycan/LPS O-acetylase OafA/YrhL
MPRQIPTWRYLRLPLAAAGLGALWLGAVGMGETSPLSGSAGTAGAVCLFLAVLGAPLAPAPMIYLGRISYGLDVFHLLTLNVAKVGLLRLIGDCPWWMRAALALPVTIALAAGSFRWLEQPFLRLKGRRPAHGGTLLRRWIAQTGTAASARSLWPGGRLQREIPRCRADQ